LQVHVFVASGGNDILHRFLAALGATADHVDNCTALGKVLRLSRVWCSHCDHECNLMEAHRWRTSKDTRRAGYHTSSTPASYLCGLESKALIRARHHADFALEPPVDGSAQTCKWVVTSLLWGVPCELWMQLALGATNGW
jgi:hypothetical protein